MTARSAGAGAAATTLLLARLSDPAAARPVDPDRLRLDLPRAPGLYAWWADDPGRELLASSLGGEVTPLIYAGQAGATSSLGVRASGATLRSRILGQHLRGNLRSSTFRRALSACLRDPLGLELIRPGRLSDASNASLTAWIQGHLRLAWVEHDDRPALAAIEHQVLTTLDPPLNLQGMPSTPGRRRLRELRRALTAETAV